MFVVLDQLVVFKVLVIFVYYTMSHTAECKTMNGQ